MFIAHKAADLNLRRRIAKCGHQNNRRANGNCIIRIRIKKDCQSGFHNDRNPQDTQQNSTNSKHLDLFTQEPDRQKHGQQGGGIANRGDFRQRKKRQSSKIQA